MEKVQCHIKGETYYYCNQMWQGPLPKTKQQKVKAADASVYLNDDGHVCIPSRQIKGCIKQAISLGKMKYDGSMVRAIQLVQAAVWVEPLDLLVIKPEIELGDTELKNHNVMTDKQKIIESTFRRVRLPWELSFILTIELIEPDFVKGALAFGCLYCGFGGRRQDKNGRSELIGWEIRKE